MAHIKKKKNLKNKQTKNAQLCLTLFDLMDYTVHGIFQARILEWVAFPSPGDRPNSGIKSGLSNCRQVLYQLGHKRSPVAAAKLLQSCPTLCDPIDGSPTGSTIPGILQARILEWVAIPFSNA